MDIRAYRDKYIRTDLACEGGSVSPLGSEGTEYSRREEDGITVERLSVFEGEGERATGRAAGTYITVSSEKIKNHFLRDSAPEKIISGEIRRLAEEMTGTEISASTKVLTAGLGNRFITADALGPLTADKINATRHVKGTLKIFEDLGCSEVSVLHTGVLGQTGIESASLIKGAAEAVKPDIIIVIDALAARSTERLASTVQLSDTGLSPGSGVGNCRLAINREQMGAPVMSVGVPTVVNSSTLIYDALEQSGMTELPPELEKLLDNKRSFFVSPKDCDLVIDYLSSVLSSAVNNAFGTADF